MKPRSYDGKYSDTISLLYKRGILEMLPRQVDRSDLQYDDGVDIILRFKDLTPRQLDEYADLILLAVYQESQRYADCKYKFAKVTVKLNRTSKGRRTLEPLLTYTAAKHTDAEVMVYGEEALGYSLPEETTKKPFLKPKLEEILEMSGHYQGEVEKTKPFMVKDITIGIRIGLDREEVKKRMFRKFQESGRGTK